LTRRDHSQQEIHQKLKLKASSQEIDAVLADLAQMGLINDARFAENYIRSRQTKGFGPLRIHVELQARGIQNEVIAEHLKITDNAWIIEARTVFRKHFKTGPAADFKERAKQIRFLQYRGFTQGQINSALGGEAIEEDL
jgi:regulatory protein